MRRVCGWCQAVLGESGEGPSRASCAPGHAAHRGPGRPEVVTHGICAPCAERHFAPYIERRRAERAPERPEERT